MDGKPVPVKKKVKTIHAVDLFCGAGGTSSGLIQAVNDLGFDINLTAINHWEVAIATHTKNHENVEHFCQAIESLNPTDVIKGGRLQLLVASPECTHHSRARGGKPRSDQKRADAWLLMRWIEKLYVENILIENVKEFIEWGPLTAFGRPDKRHKGKYFKAFIEQLKINYTVDYRVLNCADYGDPTTRERFFLIAKRGTGKKIVWPERTHASRKELAKLAADPQTADAARNLKRWVPAREIIDWSQEGTSIFGRKKPLSPNTMKRIFAGLKRYSGIEIDYQDGEIRGVKMNSRDAADAAFIVPQFSSPDTRDIGEPLGTLTTTSRGVGLTEASAFQLNLKGSERRDRAIDDPTFTQAAGGNHQGVVETQPFLVKNFSGNDEPRARPLDEPLGTVAANFNHHYVVEPEAFVFNMAHTGENADEQRHASYCKDAEDPLPTIAGKGMFGVVESSPFLISAGGPDLPAKEVEEPMRTVLTRDHQGLVEAKFLSKFHGGKDSDNRNYPIDEPIGTLDTSNRFGLVEAEPFIVSAAHGGNTNPPRDIEEPLGSVLGTPKFGVTEPFIVPFFGEREGQEPRTRDIEEPAPTVTTHGRMGLVEAEPFIVPACHSDTKAAHSVDDPLRTVLGSDKFGVVEPCMVNMKGQSTARSVDDPTYTQTGKQHQYVVEPFVLGQQSGAVARDMNEPLPTVAGKGAISLTQPFIVKFYGNSKIPDSVDDPLATVTAKDRFGLCIPQLGVILDIRFRMLQPHELAAAMSFPQNYEFTGNREDKVKQIGNAVPLRTAKALATSILTK